MSVSTIGGPQAAASIDGAGEALAVGGEHEDVERRVDGRHVGSLAEEPDGILVRDMRRGIRVVVRADPDEGRLAGQRAAAAANSPRPFSANPPADPADEQLVVGDPELGPDPAAALRVGREPLEVDPVADHPVPATLEGGPQGVAVLGVLEQLVVGEAGGQPLQPETKARLARRSSGRAHSPWQVLTTTGTPASRPAIRPITPVLGLWVCRTSRSRERIVREQLAEGREVRAGAHERVSARTGTWVTPSASTRST